MGDTADKVEIDRALYERAVALMQKCALASRDDHFLEARTGNVGALAAALLADLKEPLT